MNAANGIVLAGNNISFQVDASFNDRYFGGLKTMLRGISHQATGLPEHLHGLFVR